MSKGVIIILYLSKGLIIKLLDLISASLVDLIGASLVDGRKGYIRHRL